MAVNDKKAEKVREKTISLTAKQINELAENDVLRQIVTTQMEESEGGLTGVMAISVAKQTMKFMNPINIGE